MPDFGADLQSRALSQTVSRVSLKFRVSQERETRKRIYGLILTGTVNAERDLLRSLVAVGTQEALYTLVNTG
jgi:hypothetical protein